MLEFSDGFIVVLDKSVFGLAGEFVFITFDVFEVEADVERNKDLSDLFTMIGGVKFSKFEKGNIVIGVVFDDVHVDDVVVSVFNIVLFDDDEDDEEVDKERDD